MTIRRITMFKIPSPEHVKTLLEGYKVVAKNAVKNSQPYILTLHAGPAKPDARSQGYTAVATTEFATPEDMAYYDTECAAHNELKETAKGLRFEGPPLTVWYEAEVVSVL